MKNYRYIITSKTGEIKSVKADTLDKAIKQSGFPKCELIKVRLILDRLAA